MGGGWRGSLTQPVSSFVEDYKSFFFRPTSLHASYNPSREKEISITSLSGGTGSVSCFIPPLAYGDGQHGLMSARTQESTPETSEYKNKIMYTTEKRRRESYAFRFCGLHARLALCFSGLFLFPLLFDRTATVLCCISLRIQLYTINVFCPMPRRVREAKGKGEGGGSIQEQDASTSVFGTTLILHDG